MLGTSNCNLLQQNPNIIEANNQNGRLTKYQSSSAQLQLNQCFTVDDAPNWGFRVFAPGLTKAGTELTEGLTGRHSIVSKRPNTQNSPITFFCPQFLNLLLYFRSIYPWSSICGHIFRDFLRNILGSSVLMPGTLKLNSIPRPKSVTSA